jgi:cysteine desulfurase/selenocysteine lyase
MLRSTLEPGDVIVTTVLEHHSNFVVWQQLAQETRCSLHTIMLTPDGTIDMNDAAAKITSRTKIVAVAHASNVLGAVLPIKEFARLAHASGAVLVVDGAQAAAHLPVDVRELDCDFYAFGGHKLYGPEGVGVLFGARALLERLPPATFGGEMVGEVTIERTTWNELPYKHEAGTPPMTQAIGLAAAIRFIDCIGWRRIRRHEEDLLRYALTRLKQLPGVAVLGPQLLGPQDAGARVAVIAFVVHGIHPHDLAQVLAGKNVAVRAGNHCAQPLHCALGLQATTRASIGVYTARKDIDRLIDGVLRAQQLFRTTAPVDAAQAPTAAAPEVSR